MTTQHRLEEPITAHTEDNRLRENVLPTLARWQRAGERCVLVTLVGIDGASPRPLGAQVAVSESGRSVGMISSGCLERELVTQARDVLDQGRPRQVRYGKGSPFMDIVLPCGSGLDVYVQPDPDPAVIREAVTATAQRRASALLTHLETGNARLEHGSAHPGSPASTLSDGWFKRVYQPRPRLRIYGRGPAMVLLGQLAQTAGLDVMALTPDRDDHEALDRTGIPALRLNDPSEAPLPPSDAWTAVVVLFHDHDWDLPILTRALNEPGFYIGAQGSQRTREQRREQLLAAGIRPQTLERLQASMGLIPSAKSPVEMAVSTLADVIDAAKSHGIPC